MDIAIYQSESRLRSPVFQEPSMLHRKEAPIKRWDGIGNEENKRSDHRDLPRASV
jgi:hypothetical protein